MKWFWVAVPWLVGCSSTPVVEAPAWTRGATRTVEAGYVVYVGKGENASLDHATFQAESVALGDLANECSFTPKGARIENRFSELTEEGRHRAWAKVGIFFEECEAAKKAVTAKDIQILANVAIAEQLKRYQDQYYVSDPETAKPEATPLEDLVDYIAARQRLTYAKQAMLLSPGPYPTYVEALTTSVRVYEKAHPDARVSLWSMVQAENGASLPTGLRHAGPRAVISPRTVSRPRYSIARPRPPKKPRRMRP